MSYISQILYSINIFFGKTDSFQTKKNRSPGCACTEKQNILFQIQIIYNRAVAEGTSCTEDQLGIVILYFVFCQFTILYTDPVAYLPDIIRIQIQHTYFIAACGQHFQKSRLIPDQSDSSDIRIMAFQIVLHIPSTCFRSVFTAMDSSGTLHEKSHYGIYGSNKNTPLMSIIQDIHVKDIF